MNLEEIINWAVLKGVGESTKIDDRPFSEQHQVFQCLILGKDCQAVFLYKVDADGYHLLRGRHTDYKDKYVKTNGGIGRKVEHSDVTLEKLEKIVNEH